MFTRTDQVNGWNSLAVFVGRHEGYLAENLSFDLRGVGEIPPLGFHHVDAQDEARSCRNRREPGRSLFTWTCP